MTDWGNYSYLIGLPGWQLDDHHAVPAGRRTVFRHEGGLLTWVSGEDGYVRAVEAEGWLAGERREFDSVEMAALWVTSNGERGGE